MYWLMLPLDRHADDGFGAMGDAFHASAEALLAVEKDPISHREVPVCFLLRHAAELYLKSALVVAHRYLENRTDYPLILIGEKHKPMTTVHGLGALYQNLVAHLTKHRGLLEKKCKTSWLPMPIELDEAVAKLDAMDERGTFFRYPIGDNSSKSILRPVPLSEINDWNTERDGFLKAFLMQNQESVEAFHYVSDLLAQELMILRSVCKQLDCMHTGLRMELAGGW